VKKPVQDRSRDSTDEMLAAAFDLLNEGGLAAVTIAAVSAKSGQSNGALYFRFKSRMGLLAAVQARFLEGIEQDARVAFEQATDEAHGRRALRIVIENYLAIFSAHRRAFRALMVEGQDFDVLRERGQRTSHDIQDRLVGWLVSRFGCAREEATVAVYLLVSSVVTRVVTDDTLLMSELPDDDALAEVLTRALSHLLGVDHTPV
jgi:AcrR family transcriptional regulator